MRVRLYYMINSCIDGENVENIEILILYLWCLYTAYTFVVTELHF